VGHGGVESLSVRLAFESSFELSVHGVDRIIIIIFNTIPFTQPKEGKRGCSPRLMMVIGDGMISQTTLKKVLVRYLRRTRNSP
jgi:hypothetical protein